MLPTILSTVLKNREQGCDLVNLAGAARRHSRLPLAKNLYAARVGQVVDLDVVGSSPIAHPSTRDERMQKPIPAILVASVGFCLGHQAGPTFKYPKEGRRGAHSFPLLIHVSL
jgi:hypothetical protein